MVGKGLPHKVCLPIQRKHFPIRAPAARRRGITVRMVGQLRTLITDTITGLATLTCTIGIGRNQTLASLAVLRLLVRFPGFRFVLLASIREGLSEPERLP